MYWNLSEKEIKNTTSDVNTVKTFLCFTDAEEMTVK